MPPEFLNWLTDPAQNGAGALYDFGCYGVDLMTWLMHGETPLTVTAVANHDKPEIYPHVDDDATIVLTYPHAQAVIQASWNWPFSRKDMEVYGATGYAITVGADQLRMRHEHDAAEHLMTAPSLGANERRLAELPGRGADGQDQAEGRLERAGYQRDGDADSGCGAGIGADGADGKVDQGGGLKRSCAVEDMWYPIHSPKTANGWGTRFLWFISQRAIDRCCAHRFVAGVFRVQVIAGVVSPR